MKTSVGYISLAGLNLDTNFQKCLHCSRRNWNKKDSRPNFSDCVLIFWHVIGEHSPEHFFWSMAENGSSRCFSGQQGVYLKTIPAESVVGRIWSANSHFHPFLNKRDRVLPTIAPLLSFHTFLAILCSFPVGYSNTPHGPQGQLTGKFRRCDCGDWQKLLLFLATLLGPTAFFSVCLEDAQKV